MFHVSGMDRPDSTKASADPNGEDYSWLEEQSLEALQTKLVKALRYVRLTFCL